MEKIIFSHSTFTITCHCRFTFCDFLLFETGGSTFTEEKGVFLEQIQDLNELATAEAFTKVIVERQDNTLFGQSIGLDVPGTKRHC